MDLLKTQLDRLQKQLAGLSASQRMLTGALVVIMLMTLFWWGKYAGETDMEAITSASVAPDDLDRITTELENKGIKAVVSGDKVMVPADRKLDALSALSYARVLPKQDKAGFETMLEKMNPFLPQTTSDLMFNRGKEITVGQIVSDFPGVSDAQVMIDPTEKARIGDTIDPSATVTITMRDGMQASQQLVNAAADVVEGAQAGLQRNRIKVVVDGQPRRVQDTDNNDLGAGDQLELQQKAELRLADKVKDQFQYISGLMVSVTVKLNAASVDDKATTFDPKKVVSKPVEDNDETTQTTNGSSGGGEPGAMPNLQPGGGANAPLAVGGGGAGGGGTSENDEKHDVKFDNRFSTQETVTHTPAGDTEPVAATVRVPMSYFEEVWQRENPSASPSSAPVIPTEAQLKPLVDSELPKISDGVIKCVGLNDVKDVSVETYTDALPLATATAPAQASSMPLSMIMGHAKEIVLGGLACLSLLVVSMMVRRSTPAPLITAAVAVAPSGPMTLGNGDIIAGAAGDGGGTLDGMELDDNAVRAQQMLEQVSTMVKENPESAATLVKRWLNRT